MSKPGVLPDGGVGDHSLNRDEDDEINNIINSESRTPLKLTSKESEVKFSVIDGVNGDAKVDLGDMKTGFVGMSKEELMKYVNDPFWVRIRAILFILFWVIWVAMFVAAIAIIVVAPRCPMKRTWYEEGPIVDVALPKALKSNLSQISDKLDYFKTLNAKAIILPPIFAKDDMGDVLDFEAVGNDYGTLEDLKLLIAEAKKRAIRVLLTLVPNHSSVKHTWFNQSRSKELGYADYYVWAQKSSEPRGLPNNWLSVSGTSLNFS